MVSPVERLVMSFNVLLYIQSVWSDTTPEAVSVWMNYFMLTILYFSALVTFCVFGRKIKNSIDDEFAMEAAQGELEEHVCSEACQTRDTKLPSANQKISNVKKGSVKKVDAKKTSAHMLCEDKRQLKDYKFIETVKRNRKQRSFQTKKHGITQMAETVRQFGEGMLRTLFFSANLAMCFSGMILLE